MRSVPPYSISRAAERIFSFSRYPTSAGISAMRVKPHTEQQSRINDFLDLARARHGMRSDKQLAVALHVGSPAVSNWRHGKSNVSPMTCMKLAELAELPPRPSPWHDL
jgi:transcriptional regulator with XRE-family HTH domain